MLGAVPHGLNKISIYINRQNWNLLYTFYMVIKARLVDTLIWLVYLIHLVVRFIVMITMHMVIQE